METPQETLKNLPHTPGIYIYKNQNGVILYIGKAKDLKKRVAQYFSRDDAVGEKTDRLVSQISRIETIQTVSELDALLLEAALIRQHRPKYNVVLKDDKSPLYILLTLSEPLPHVLTIRKNDLPAKIKSQDALFGPFQSAGVVRSLLRALRHTIPYCTQKRRTGTPCFYAHIGLCDPCPSDKHTDAKVYRKNIFRLKNILSGKSNTVLKELEKDMNAFAKENRFEEAASLRNHIRNLYGMLAKRYDPVVYMRLGAAEDIYATELAALEHVLGIHPLTRIECFDISNTSGTHATGSMVVLTDGKKDTDEYRRFRIRRKNTPNDFAMMKEVITRRFTHSEWPTPTLIVVDGGKGQLTAVKEVISGIPVIGLAKRFEEIIVPLPGNTWKVLRLDLTSPALHVLERIRDEAHRFAITYHRLLRKKAFGTIEAG